MPNYHIKMKPTDANVYGLLGKDENALSSALSHLMLIDSTFMVEVLKEMGVLSSKQGKSYKNYKDEYTITLQEQSESGRKDIVIEAGTADDLRVVIEAKIGKGVPSPCQLLRYSVGCDCHPHHNPEEIIKTWGERKKKYIVSLTRDCLSTDTSSYVRKKLSNSGIELHTIQWYKIYEVALHCLKQKHTDYRQPLFLQEFVRFFKEYYEMKSYQAEVMVKQDNFLNAEKVYLDGYMYVGRLKDIQDPLYFAPYFIKDCVGKIDGVKEAGISYISQVIKVIQCDVRSFPDNPEAVADAQILKYKTLWPHWRKGLAAIAKRIEQEKEGGKWPEQMRLYFLSKPAKLGRTVKGPDRIPIGYSTTIYDLLTQDVLKKNPDPE